MEEKINFICKGINRNYSSSQMRKCIMGCSVLFYLAEIIFCFTMGNLIVKAYGVIVLLSTLCSLAYVFIVSKHWTVQTYLSAFGVFSLEGMINITLFALAQCEIAGYSMSIKIFAIIIPLITMASYLLIYSLMIKNATYKHPKKEIIKYFGALGAGMGLVFAKILFSSISEDMTTLLIILFFILFSAMASLKSINFYKLKLLKDINYDEEL